MRVCTSVESYSLFNNENDPLSIQSAIHLSQSYSAKMFSLAGSVCALFAQASVIGLNLKTNGAFIGTIAANGRANRAFVRTFASKIAAFALSIRTNA
jgi:hypothetical protein